MYSAFEKTQLSRSTDPEKWKAHFLRMKDNNLTKRGRRVLVGGSDSNNPVLKVISPAQESVSLAKGLVKTIKEEEASQNNQKSSKPKSNGSKSNSSTAAKKSSTAAKKTTSTSTCKRTTKTWRRRK